MEKEYEVIEEYPQINYTLVKRKTTFEPWIASYGYNKEDGTWRQGHYFQTCRDAVRYIESKLQMIPFERMSEIATQMLHYLKDNEELEDALECMDIDLDESEMEYFGLQMEDEEYG